jgi:hypothetical protein
MRKLFSTISGIAVLSTLLIRANAQITDQGAREQASNVVRSELRATLNLKPDQFLGVQRDEALEQSLLGHWSRETSTAMGRSTLRSV